MAALEFTKATILSSPLGEHANINFGGTFSGSESAAGVGFGVDIP